MNNEQKLLLKLLSKKFSILNSNELLTSSLQTNPSEQTFFVMILGKYLLN